MNQEFSKSKKTQVFSLEETLIAINDNIKKIRGIYESIIHRKEQFSEQVFSLLIETIQHVIAIKSIPVDFNTNLVEFIDLVEAFKTLDKKRFVLFRSKDLSRIMLFYCELCYMTSDKKIHSILYNLLHKSSEESIASLQEFIIFSNKINAIEKIDWNFVFRLYISLFLKTQVKNLNSDDEKTPVQIFKSLFENCNRFFTTLEDPLDIFQKEFPKNAIVKHIFLKNKKFRVQLDIVDLLIFKYQTYLCEHFISFLMGSLENKSNKLTLSLQDYFLNFLIQTLTRYIKIVLELYKQSKSHPEIKLGSSCSCFPAHLGNGNQVTFQDKAVCDQCIFISHASESENGPSNFQTVQHKGNNLFTIAGNLNVFLVLLFMKQCSDSGFTIQVFSENLIEDIFELTIEGAKTQNPETKSLHCLYKIHLQDLEKTFMNKTHTIFLFLLTQHKNSPQFLILSSKLCNLIDEFPSLAFLGEYFRVFTLLQFEANLEAREFVVRVFETLIFKLPAVVLFEFKFKARPIIDCIIEFAINNLSEENQTLSKTSTQILNQVIQNKWLNCKIQAQINAIQLTKTEFSEHEIVSDEKNDFFASPISNWQSLVAPVDLKKIINSLDANEPEKLLTIVQIMFNLFFKEPNSGDDCQTKSTKKVSRSKQSKYQEQKTLENLQKMLFLFSLQRRPMKLSAFWFNKFIDFVHLNNRILFKDMCQYIVDRSHLFVEPQLSGLLLIVFGNEKIIRNNNFLAEISIKVASILLETCRKSLDEASGVQLFQSSNAGTIIRVSKMLVAVLNILNKNEFNLFYKEQMSELHLFITENLFYFPLAVFKELIKLKIKIDLNFQTYNSIEINLRKNANFLSLSILAISASEKENDSSSEQSELFLPIIKCVYAVRKMIELLPQKLFHSNFQNLIFELVNQVLSMDEPLLIKEAFFVIPKFFEFEIIKVPQLYGILDLVLAKKFGVNVVLKLSHKLLNSKSNLEFVGFIWRKYVSTFFDWIQKQIYSVTPKSFLKQFPSENSDGEHIAVQSDIIQTLLCIKELASLREIDLIALLIKCFSWIFAPNLQVSVLTLTILRQLVHSDSRLISNKGIGYELTKSLFTSFSLNSSILSVSDFVIKFVKILARLKSISLENILLESLAQNIIEFEQISFEKNGVLISGFDVLFFTIFSICQEKIKIQMLVVIIDVLVPLIQKSEMDFLINKKNYEQNFDSSVNNFGAFYRLPILLTKYHYYLFFVNSLIMCQVVSEEDISLKNQRELVGCRINLEVAKFFKEMLGKRSHFYLEINHRHLQLLANKIDVILSASLFQVLKKMLKKMQNVFFIENFENDEFNEELFTENKFSHSKPKKLEHSDRKSLLKVSKEKKKEKNIKLKTENKKKNSLEKDCPDLCPNDLEKRYNFRTTAKRKKQEK